MNKYPRVAPVSLLSPSSLSVFCDADSRLLCVSVWAAGVNVMSNVDGVFPFGVETADETQFLAGLKDDSLLPPLSAREYVTEDQ